MNSDELKASAERMSDWCTRKGAYPELLNFTQRSFVNDAFKISNALLARLAADDKAQRYVSDANEEINNLRERIAQLERERDEARAAYCELRDAAECDLGSIGNSGDASFYLGSTLRAFKERPDWRKGGTDGTQRKD